MNKNEVIKNLYDLIKLDIDASSSYLKAVEKVDDVDIKEQLMTFREDHERHIDSLSEELKKMGETPPKRNKDVKGYLQEGYTALRSVTGTTGALAAMRTNEKLTNKKYSDEVKLDAPEEIHHIIQQNYEDERTHLKYINIKLDELE